ncbi:hypothetical protein J8273_3668 [Carpediemonas membranifera]|uniref:Uncharacterized protein n=1 Tax=Carpediemonas membranifera TaxID=201153 RepID=A0A8J6AU29_9EUKA|nr:hypothetical protein J8273_3668 [Carpediemonas membranifera]|eukprot:KAG9394696.1 hypothetical protein J8273_3668 [Carpediemonas membranifera]
MWRDPDIIPLVRDFREAYVGIAFPFQRWLGEYSTATRVWLSRASPGYLTRLRTGLERVRPLLHDRPGVRQDFLDTLGELDTEVAAIAADHGMHHRQMHALPEEQRVGRTGTVAEALVGVLSCVTRMSAAVTKLVTLTRAVNLELSQALPEPKLVPFVPMAPVRPGFMTIERGYMSLTPAMKRRLRVHVNWSASRSRVWGCTVLFRRHSLLCSVPPLCSSTSWHHAPAQRRRECHDGLRIPHFHRVPILQSTLQTCGANTPHHDMPESRVRGSSMAR